MSQMSPLQKMKAAYRQAYTMPRDDKLIVDCYMGILVAAFTPRLDESVWMYWVGPPGSGKTLAVAPMYKHSRVMMLSVPTPNALMSGYTNEDGSDPSLIPLLNGKVLIWKDFTALMKQGKVVVAKVVGEFRDCYDQHCSKHSGSSGLREYESRFGMIACATDEIDEFTNEHQQLGERFLTFRMNRIKMTHNQRVEDLRPIVDGMGKKKAWVNALQKYMHIQIDKLLLTTEKMDTPSFCDEYNEQVRIMADLLALTRTSCGTTARRAELATRLVQQMINLGHGHCLADMRTTWNETEIDLLKRVMMDSLSADRQRLIAYMYSRGQHRPAVTLAQMTLKSGSTEKQMQQVIRQYVFSSVLDPVREPNSNDTWYRLAEDIYKSIEKIGVLA